MKYLTLTEDIYRPGAEIIICVTEDKAEADEVATYTEPTRVITMERAALEHGDTVLGLMLATYTAE